MTSEPARTVRISDQLWRAAKIKAITEGRTISDVVREALEKYVNDKSRDDAGD